MRRARIKALAAVPVRKKPVQDSVDSVDTNDATDKEKKEENIFNINETEQEAIKDVAKEEKDVARTDAFERREQKEDISSTDIPEQEKQKEDIPSTGTLEQEVAEDVAKIQEETTEKEQNTAVSLTEPVIVEKLNRSGEHDSQELCSPLKPDFQELCVETKLNSQESLSTGIKFDKATDQLVQKSVPLSDVPTAIDIGRDYVKKKKLRVMDRTYKDKFFIF